jgi:hypothetical protein
MAVSRRRRLWFVRAGTPTAARAGAARRASAPRPPPGACVDDDLAPNHAPDFAVALDTAVHTERMACAGRDDWYIVEDLVGLRVVARFAADRRPLTVSLYPARRGFGVPWTRTPARSARASWRRRPVGYLLRVSAPPGPRAPTPSRSRAGSPACDDAFERPWRNDAAALPSRLGLGRFDATLCGADVDHYVVPVAGRLRLSHTGVGRATVDGAGGVPADHRRRARLVTWRSGRGGPARRLLHSTMESERGARSRLFGGGERPARCGSLDATVADAARDDFAAACCHALGGTERVFRVRAPSAAASSGRDSSPPRAAPRCSCTATAARRPSRVRGPWEM